jgi:hypothetical protein
MPAASASRDSDQGRIEYSPGVLYSDSPGERYADGESQQRWSYCDSFAGLRLSGEALRAV